jgi:RHS repeat-associated protein
MVEFNDQDTGSVHRYSYDALGRRIAKIVDAFGSPQETRYFYDGGRVIEEQDGGGSTQAFAVQGLGCGGHVFYLAAGQGHYYHCDDSGNTVAMTDAGGNVVERYEYGDYGAPSITDGSGTPLPESAIGNPYLFNGRRYDPETGWYVYGTRYLDPKAGRYVTRSIERVDIDGMEGDDSLFGLRGGGLGNAYTYAGNNPWSTSGGRGHGHGHLNHIKQVGDPVSMFQNYQGKNERYTFAGSGSGDITAPNGGPVMAAIAIPNLLDARKSGNESAASGYAVYYGETDYNFISRLMEEEGIYYSMPLLPPILDDRRWRALQTSRVTVRGWDPVQKQALMGTIRRVRGAAAAIADGTCFPKVNIDLCIAGGTTPTLRKLPGRLKYGDITLKRGALSLDPPWTVLPGSSPGSSFGNGLQLGGALSGKYENGLVDLSAGLLTGISFPAWDGAAKDAAFFEAWPAKWKGFDLICTGAVFPKVELSAISAGTVFPKVDIR